MPSFSAWLFRLYVVWVMRAKKVISSAEQTLESVRALYLSPESFHPPKSLRRDVQVDRVDVNGWPLFRVSSKTGRKASKEPRPAMLYVHGGGYFREIAPPHWTFVAQIAAETDLDVLVPIYPLVPRPTATAEKIVAGLIEVCRLSGHPVVCVAGDSAGGHLALAAAQQMQTLAPDLAAQLRCLVLISPVLDCAFDHPDVIRLAREDPWLSPEGLQAVAPKLAAGLAMDDPVVSPLYGDVEHLPPVLLMCGTADMLCSDARRLSAKFQGKGVAEGVPGSVELDRFTYIEKAEMLHVYPLLPHTEGTEARELIVHFIGKHMTH